LFAAAKREILRGHMATNGKTLGHWALLGSFAVILYFCFRIMQPFLMPVFLALILSTLLTPLYEKIAARFHGRTSLAALLICLGLTVAIVLPVVLLSVSLAREANDVYEQMRDPEMAAKLRSWLNPNTNPVLAKIKTWLPASLTFPDLDVGERIGSQAQAILTGTLAFTTTLAAGVINFLMDYIIMVVVLFFLLRDSAYFANSVRQISPLSDREESMFVERFRVVTQATVLGSLATAVAQGILSTLIFWIIGLPNPILWGALTSLLSLVPVVGTALVWIPWTIYLFSTGAMVRAIVFMALQIVLVGGIDNVLRPLLIEGRVKMHTLVVFFSILGGIGYFGILGIFIGPLVFAIAIAFVEFYGSRDNSPDPPLDSMEC
jgi:predicted PurR-regulated permease PerM